MIDFLSYKSFLIDSFNISLYSAPFTPEISKIPFPLKLFMISLTFKSNFAFVILILMSLKT